MNEKPAYKEITETPTGMRILLAGVFLFLVVPFMAVAGTVETAHERTEKTCAWLKARLAPSPTL